MPRFTSRDQNSSPGATITRRSPEGPGQRGTLHARTGAFQGKTRNYGQKSRVDANSSPKVTRIQPRTPDGKYASHENDLLVVHPKGRVTRQPKTSALGIHRKGRGSETRGYVETKKNASGLVAVKTGVSKALPMRAAVRRGLGMAMNPAKVTGTGAGAMRQSARVTAAQRQGVVRTNSRGGKYLHQSNVGRNANDAVKPLFGRGNTRFGGAPARGRRVS